MPPKSGKGKKPPIVIEGIDTTEMTFPQLQQYMLQIYEKLLKEREERTYFQLERDKLRTIWDISRKQLDEARAELRNKDYELELAEDKRLHDLHEVNQKVKYLYYEQNFQLNDKALKEKETLQLAEKDYMDQESELLTDKKELKNKIKNLEEHQTNEIKALRLQHGKESSEMSQDFEKKLEEMEFKYEKHLNVLKAKLDTKHKLELGEVEERKNTQIKTLTENHKNAFDDIRNYFNNITLNNLSLITNLKDNIEEMKRKDAVKDKTLKEVLKENKTLTEGMERQSQEMDNLKHQLATYNKETLGVISMKREMQKAKSDLDKLQWDYNVLDLKYENVRNDKSKTEAEKMLQAAEVQKEVGGRICYLEEKLKALRGQVERRENLINEIRKAIQQGKALGDKGVLMRDTTAIITNYDEMRSRRMTHRQSLLFN